MTTGTHSTSGKAKRQGRYQSVGDAVQQKQEALLSVLAGADLASLSIDENPLAGHKTGNNVSDVPYEEVK